MSRLAPTAPGLWTPAGVARVKPAWAQQADDAKFWAWVDTNSVPDYASADYAAQYLLNVAPIQKSVNLHIDGIEVGADGATIAVRATARCAGASAEAGDGSVDLTKINGVLSVAVGSSVGSLTPKAIPSGNVSYNAETHVATIVIPGADGAFVQARIDFTAPAEPLTADE